MFRTPGTGHTTGYGKDDITITSPLSRTDTPMRYSNEVNEREHPGIRPCATYRKQGHVSAAILTTMGIVILLCLVLGAGASAAGTKTAYMGDMVTLSGSSPGSDIVYLFMTGPNLPPNGVALNNINRRADMGGFTTADVDPDGRWVYKWYTNQLGGKIDTGTYTIWVTDRPVDRSHLSGSDYHSIPVLLQQPGIVAWSSTASGALMVRTIPKGAVLFLNGENRGVTPVTITDLPVGNHLIIVSFPGYQNLTTQAVVKEGTVTEVIIPLSSVNGSVFVNTTPAGAETPSRSQVASTPPTRASGVIPATIVLLMIALMLLGRRTK